MAVMAMRLQLEGCTCVLHLFKVTLSNIAKHN
jgi:hypothetical protein